MFRTEARGYAPFSSQPKANFWTHRSLLEKILLGIVSILFVTFLVMVLNFVQLQQQEERFLKPLDDFDADGARMAGVFAHSRLHKRDVSEVAIPAVLEDLPQEPSETDSLADESKAIRKPQSSTAYSPKICYSEGCIHTASKLLSNMNQSVDPCQDFYRFTCGRFLEESVIPDDKPELSSFSVIRDQLKLQIRTIIEEPAKDSDIKPFRLAKNFYKVCMNETQIELQGLDHMKSILKQLGGWPVLEGASWDEGSFTWEDSVYKFRRYGYALNYFLAFGIGVNLKNSSERVILIDQASLPTVSTISIRPGLSREYLVKGLDETIEKAYYEYMIDIAVFMGADREAAVKELRESRDFEIALANISSPETERRNATKLYNPMKITELQERYPSIPWTEYINTILSPNAQLKDDETIIVMEPEYIHDLEKLLSTTPKRTMANYVMWRATADSVSYLTEAIRARQSAYIKAVTGVSEQQARWKDCVDAVKASFPLAIGSLYVRKYFKEAAKSNAVEMVQLMREEMYKIISSVDWMDEVTRQAALDKAKFMTPYIAYPEEFLINAKLEEYYSGLEVEPTNFLEAGLNLTRFGVNYAISQLRKPVNKTDWITHGKTTEVNAFYALNENSIQLPAGILQGIFFSNDRPKYMNYGTMGFVIGHEITHGFDDQGRQYDKDGNLVDWWAESTKEKFLKKVECIIEQYGNYSVPEVNMTLNGINTQGENIADNGGIKEAYNAYNVWTGEHGEEPRLPGLQQYSPRQMFWISAASTWCTLVRPERLKFLILTDTHSPSEFRVLGPLSNLKEFARDFQCPVGSRMNPPNKCEVW